MTLINRYKIQFSGLFTSLTCADRWLIGILFTMGVLSLFMVSSLRQPGETVLIYIDNTLRYRFDLNQAREQVLHSPKGRMMIKISGGRVWVEDSSCPNKICMKMGKISQAGQMIVCVPNGVMIRIGGQENTYIDVITQ